MSISRLPFGGTFCGTRCGVPRVGIRPHRTSNSEDTGVSGVEKLSGPADPSSFTGRSIVMPSSVIPSGRPGYGEASKPLGDLTRIGSLIPRIGIGRERDLPKFPNQDCRMDCSHQSYCCCITYHTTYCCDKRYYPRGSDSGRRCRVSDHASA